MPRRILHFASGDVWGGLERVVESLAAAGTSDSSPEALLLNEGQLADALRAHDVPVTIIDEGNRSLLRLLADVRRFLRVGRFDVVHCHRYKEVFLAVLALGFDARRVVVTLHGMEPLEQTPFLLYLRILGPLVLARLCGARFTAVSRELVARAAAWPLAARAQLIPNAMPTLQEIAVDPLPDLRVQFGWRADRPVVGFIGRLERVKGPDLFLEVAKRAPERFGFVLIGSGSLEADIQARCEAAGLAERVRFLGFVRNALPLLRQLDVLALTSRHEGTPLVVLEAAAFEIPVVAFAVGGIPDLLREAPESWSVPVESIDAFSEVLRGIERDPAGARQSARRWAAHIRSRHGAAQIAEAYADVYRRGLGGNRARDSKSESGTLERNPN